MGVCSYHQKNIESRLTNQDESNEKEYLSVARKYSSKELEVFAKAIGTLSLSVQKAPYSDVLGKYFTEHVTNGHNGQYFTPEALSSLMSSLSSPQTVEHKSVFDPTCGSGRLLLHFATKHPNNFFFGSDNNETYAKMSTLNFFLNGLRGEVAWMNPLSNEWYGGWQVNLNGAGILPIEKEKSMIWEKTFESPPPELSRSKEEGNHPQLSLF